MVGLVRSYIQGLFEGIQKISIKKAVPCMGPLHLILRKYFLVTSTNGRVLHTFLNHFIELIDFWKYNDSCPPIF